MRIGTMGYANSKYFNDNTVPWEDKIELHQ